jgi:gliding motility-associated-like protein
MIQNIKIFQKDKNQSSSFMRAYILCFSALMMFSDSLFSQVISNNGASVTVTSGIVVETKDVENIASGEVANNGTISMFGNYTSNATTSGNGLFRLGGSWTNTGGVFIPGSSTVLFNGSGDQLIIRTGGESFWNMSVSNSGAPSSKSVKISNDVNVLGTLTMSLGNIDAGTYLFFLKNQAVASLNYTSVTGSRVFGKFQRGINETGTYLFPLGTSAYYNPANLTTNNVVTAGSVLSQFITSPAPGNTGLPISDSPVEVWETYSDGFWRLTSNSFSSNDFDLNLNATGFIDTVRSITRLIKRTAGGNWTVDGIHAIADSISNVVYRDNLTGDISPIGSEFALGRTRPLITLHPVSQTLCEAPTDAVFSVVATGAYPITYRWYHDGVIIENGVHYSGARTNTLTVKGLVLSDAGTYYCIVSDRYRQKTQSNSATLIVNKRPVATATPSVQLHECSNMAFEDIVLGETYGVPGTSYVWTRNNPAGISSAIPMTGTAANIGDVIAGMFNNTLDAPTIVTFIITPVGPAPTYCTGLLPVEASVTINPTPRIDTLNLNFKPEMCYGQAVDIKLNTPTQMTQGQIMFDYIVSVSGIPGEVIAGPGGIAPGLNKLPGTNLNFTYQNNADSMRSVFYSVLPKNPVSGCDPGPIVVPEVKVHPKPLQSMFISTPFTCSGGTAGVLTSILSKVSKPDNILWKRPLVADTTYFSSTYTDNLPVHISGNYQVTVKDNFGCQTTSPIQYVTGTVFNTFLYVKDTDTGYGTSCPDSTDGIIQIWEDASTTTAVPPYEFWLIHENADTIAHDIIFAPGLINRKEYTGLSSGNYALFIRDANGCFNTDWPATTITEPDTISVKFGKREYAGGYNISCKGYNDGSVWVDEISGGNLSGYEYKWYTYDGLITGPDTLPVLDTISAGTYYLLVTDLHSCPEIFTVTLTEPEGISLEDFEVSYSPDGAFNIGCTGDHTGYIKIEIDGGSGNYNYLWSNGATTANISNLEEGTYIATVTDQANSSCILMPQPTFTLSEPLPLDVTAVKSLAPDLTNSIPCYGGTGSIDITVTGGSAGVLQYLWDSSDGSGIIQGQQDQPALTAGTYHLLVTDANGCTKPIDVTLTQPSKLLGTLHSTDITCVSPLSDNGSVDLQVTGGFAPYSYLWSNNAISEDISDLTEGAYSVVVTDVDGCQWYDTIQINPPPPVEYSRILSDYLGYNISCSGLSDGSIDVTISNGLAPFQFTWTGPDGFIATTEDIANLKAGDYTLNILDANFCTATELITLTEQGRLSMSFDPSFSTAGGKNINCAGTNSGMLDVIPINAVGEVSYHWSDGSTLQNRTNLFAGDYSLVITDSNGCPADSSFTLSEPDTLKISFEVTQPWCTDKPDGSITVIASGGVPGVDYTYRWSDNSTGNNVSDIQVGWYRVDVSDLNGCVTSDSVHLKPQNETCLIIPNAISPNEDYINDVWNIGLIELYPEIEIKVFNRWGTIVWRSEKGYPHPWDGRSNGKLLPMDSYHYIVDYNDGRKPLVGNITIIR